MSVGAVVVQLTKGREGGVVCDVEYGKVINNKREKITIKVHNKLGCALIIPKGLLHSGNPTLRETDRYTLVYNF